MPTKIPAVSLYRAARKDLESELPEEVDHAIATLTRAGDAATLWLVDAALFDSSADTTVSRALKIIRRTRPALAAYLAGERAAIQVVDGPQGSLSEVYLKFSLQTSRTPIEWAAIVEDNRRWRCHAHAKHALAAYGWAAQPVVDEWSKHKEFTFRYMAALLVADMMEPNPLYVDLISRLATDEDFRVRGGAAKALARLSGESSALSALRRLSADPVPSVRQDVCESLVEAQSDAEVALEFGETGLKDEDAGVRAAALTLFLALVNHPPVRLLPSLQSVLTEKETAVAAATLIGRMGTAAQTAVESLEKARDNTGNWTEIDAIEAAIRAVGGVP